MKTARKYYCSGRKKHTPILLCNTRFRRRIPHTVLFIRRMIKSSLILPLTIISTSSSFAARKRQKLKSSTNTVLTTITTGARFAISWAITITMLPAMCTPIKKAVSSSPLLVTGSSAKPQRNSSRRQSSYRLRKYSP